MGRGNRAPAPSLVALVASGNYVASVTLEPVAMITVFEGFPQVHGGESPAGLKLLDIPQFVQE